MVRIWISRRSTISLREQVSAQLRFGILSGRLAPEQRLPSVRDLARRLKIHGNTVSAAYQDLVSGGWVIAKGGSGMFVRNIRRDGSKDSIETFVRACIEEGIAHGYTLEELLAQFQRVQPSAPTFAGPRGLLIVHSDLNFARILAAEIEASAGSLPHCAIPEQAGSPEFSACLVLTTVSSAPAVAQVRADPPVLVPLKSIEHLLADAKLPQEPQLTGVVSRSETVLRWASLLIATLGGSARDLIARNPAQLKWRDGLAACDLVVADVLAAAELPKHIRPGVLRLVPASFLDEVARRVGVAGAPREE